MGGKRITEAQKALVIEKISKGISQKDIIKSMGVSSGSIWRILKEHEEAKGRKANIDNTGIEFIRIDRDNDDIKIMSEREVMHYCLERMVDTM